MTDSYPWDVLEEPSTRTPRAVEGRESSVRPREWREPTVIPEIPPRDGWSFKWVRVSSRMQEDKGNFSKRRREGWEPVRLEEMPWLIEVLGTDLTSGNVETGGLLLCRMPTEMVEQRNRHYREIARAQRTSAEESYMRDDREVAMAKVVEKNRSVFVDRR